MPPFVLISPATRGLSLALTRHFLRTTALPVFGTYRPNSPTESHRTPDAVRKHILGPLSSTSHEVDPSRLRLLPLDFTSEESIAKAADALANALSELSGDSSYIRIAFFCAGMLYPERQPADLVLDKIMEIFTLNTISHLLMVKHFSRFLPPPDKAPSPSTSDDSQEADRPGTLAKWVHVSARVGSVSDNHLGGWYSYRASKAALNQVIRTFDLHLQAKKAPAICVGVHPGTVKTDLSKPFWKGVQPGKLFEPEDAAKKLVEVVKNLGRAQRGRIWDWKGEEVKP